MLDLSVIILTFNEEIHIRRCLENISDIAKKIYIIDCYSTDKTIEIAKTFDNVCIDIGRGTFAPGQLYVALSRCTSLQGIRLKTKLLPRHIMCDERICEFMKLYGQPSNLQDKIKRLQMAAQKRQKIDISYQKADGKISRRVIIPLHIKGENLQAFCTQRQEQRSFNLERILEIRNFAE